MNTLAHQVADHVEKASAASFSGACAIVNDRWVTLPQGVQELETRNTNGRIVRARYRYADNSSLTFTWSELSGPKLTVTSGQGA